MWRDSWTIYKLKLQPHFLPNVYINDGDKECRRRTECGSVVWIVWSVNYSRQCIIIGTLSQTRPLCLGKGEQDT